MAEAITIARPYAHAIFEIAQQKSELKAWSELLALLGQCVQKPEIQSIINSPAVTHDRVVGLLADIAGDAVTQDVRNFLLLLAENERLLFLPQIATLFDELRAEAEKTLIADVISAKALTAEQSNKISAALKNRLGRDITLNTRVDESLLGGAIIQAGDLVIDGSALSKLNRLANAIN